MMAFLGSDGFRPKRLLHPLPPFLIWAGVVKDKTSPSLVAPLADANLIWVYIHSEVIKLCEELLC